MIAKNMTCQQRLSKPLKKRQTIIKFKSCHNKKQNANVIVDNNIQSDDSSSALSKKKVSFSSMADVTTVPNITREEAEERWYTSKEYKSFEHDRKRTLSAFRIAIEKSIRLDKYRFSSIGLESVLTYHHQCQRRFHIMRHNCYVLIQQHYQKCMGANDPETLQAISVMFSQNKGEIDFLTIVDSDGLEKMGDKLSSL